MKTALPVLALLIAGVIPSVLTADEVSLRDGRVIEGDVVAVPESKDVDVRTRIGGMTAVIHLKGADIVKISYGQTATQRRLEAFDAKRAELVANGATVQQWWALALEAKALGEHPAEREIARQVIAMEPNHAQARALLGYVKQDGEWMKTADAAVARGEVYFRGKWVPAAQRDGVLDDEARAAKVAEEQVAKDRADRAAELELAKKEADLRAARIAAEPPPAQPTTQIIYTTITPAYPLTSVWGVQPPIVYRPYGQHTGGVQVITTPRQPCPPLAPGSSGLSVQASGQGNGYTWSMQSR